MWLQSHHLLQLLTAPTQHGATPLHTAAACASHASLVALVNTLQVRGRVGICMGVQAHTTVSTHTHTHTYTCNLNAHKSTHSLPSVPYPPQSNLHIRSPVCHTPRSQIYIFAPQCAIPPAVKLQTGLAAGHSHAYTHILYMLYALYALFGGDDDPRSTVQDEVSASNMFATLTSRTRDGYTPLHHVLVRVHPTFFARCMELRLRL